MAGTLLKYAEALTLDNTGKHAGQAGFNPKKIVQYGFSAGNAGAGYPDRLGELPRRKRCQLFLTRQVQRSTPLKETRSSSF